MPSAVVFYSRAVSGTLGHMPLERPCFRAAAWTTVSYGNISCMYGRGCWKRFTSQRCWHFWAVHGLVKLLVFQISLDETLYPYSATFPHTPDTSGLLVTLSLVKPLTEIVMEQKKDSFHTRIDGTGVAYIWKASSDKLQHRREWVLLPFSLHETWKCESRCTADKSEDKVRENCEITQVRPYRSGFFKDKIFNDKYNTIWGKNIPEN